MHGRLQSSLAPALAPARRQNSPKSAGGGTRCMREVPSLILVRPSPWNTPTKFQANRACLPTVVLLLFGDPSGRNGYETAVRRPFFGYLATI